jgi:hypothetical protein
LGVLADEELYKKLKYIVRVQDKPKVHLFGDIQKGGKL